MLQRFPIRNILTLVSMAIYADQQTKSPSLRKKSNGGYHPPGYLYRIFHRPKDKGTTHRNLLKIATRAAAICVTRRGAADSIPLKQRWFYDE